MSKRVLICEDDHGIRLLLDKLLNRHGLCSDSASTGAEASCGGEQTQGAFA